MKQADLPFLLIVANSGRMLAQAARRAGYLPLVVDLYGDLDTLRYAGDYFGVAALDVSHLDPVLTHITEKYAVTQAIYGAGFEAHPESLALMAKRFALWGNNPEAFIKSTDKLLLFNSMKQNSIVYPAVRFASPNDKEHWLIKPWRGHGGAGIKPAKHNDKREIQGYWQKYQAGQPHSVLFLADGERAIIVGFNRQWTVQLGGHPYRFAGIINSTKLTAPQKARLLAWVEKLTRAFSLKGLNSMDFIENNPGIFVLEINARPPASMQLYEDDLLALHIAACQGELPSRISVESGVAGYQIVYAPQTLKVHDDVHWPEGAVDIPQAGAIINTHQPICSIIARKNAPDAVRRQLNQAQEFILNQLTQT